MLSHRRRANNLLLSSLGLMLALACLKQVALGQRGGNSGGGDNSGDDDDFDDAGFDDSGYNQPVQRETESSNHSPNNYNPSSSEDLDDDDDEVDESHVSPQVADEAEGPTNDERRQAGQADEPGESQQHQLDQQLAAEHHQRRQQQQQQHQVPFLDNVQTQNFYAPPSAMFVANLHPSEAGLAPINQYDVGGHSSPAAHMRYRRSSGSSSSGISSSEPEGDIEDESSPADGAQKLVRRKRHAKGHKYIGPVYTYVKTDKHANFKWGVKHKVGKHYG